ncbi:NUDIX domain-containing protein [Candidatus Woesearchaeota archaeon]|nr:NUDIX domain-containing protein [Candidatus Woesearchaeota archaeon]
MPELMDVIDRNGKIIGSATREEIRRRNLLHRGVAVVVFNSKAQVFVNKRVMKKDIYRGMYDMFCGGGVQSGESPESAATRELKEELGIKNPETIFLFKKRCRSDNNNVLMHIYACKYDGRIKIQKEEIEKGFFLSVPELEELVKKNQFCPKGPYLFRLCKKYLDQIR